MCEADLQIWHTVFYFIYSKVWGHYDLWGSFRGLASMLEPRTGLNLNVTGAKWCDTQNIRLRSTGGKVGIVIRVKTI